MDERTRPTDPASAADPATAPAAGGRPQGNSGAAEGRTPAAATAETARVAWVCKFDTLRLALYHQARRVFLDACHRWAMFLVIVSGSAAFADVAGAPLFAFIPVLVASLDVVFRFADRARDHELLYRRYLAVHGQIATTAVAQAPDTERWQAELHQIYQDTPPNHFHALDAWAHNKVCVSEGITAEGGLCPISFWQRLMRNVLPFSGADFSG